MTLSVRDAAGASQNVATDLVAGEHSQQIKLLDGLVGSAVAQRVRGDPPGQADGGAVVRQAPVFIWNCSFADVGSSLITPEMTQRRLGTGMGVTQAGGNLLVTTGTTANSEFLARSLVAFNGALIARWQTLLSQRIANNNFAVMLADRIGEGLSCTINSATSITVTFPAPHGFTAAQVGQSMLVGAITGANGVPGRWAIASVPTVDTINFTVVGWPASGSCTVDLFGLNYFRVLYTGTTATNAAWDTQRRGWASGDTTLTINTTASPGHMAQVSVDGRNAYVSDALVASSGTPNVTTRGHRVVNMPDPDVDLFVYLWAWNGTAAPASTTTWTVGFVAVEDTTNQVVYLGGMRPQGTQTPMPVVFPAAQAVSGTVGVTGYPTAAASADGLANPTVTKLDALLALFNGTTWDRQRGNTAVSVEASAARTTTATGTSQINHNARGVYLFVNVTAVSGTTPALAVRLQVQDPVSATWVDLPGAVTASLTAAGLTMLTVYPDVTAAANVAVDAPLPRTWRAAWTITGTTPSFTFSVGAQYIL